MGDLAGFRRVVEASHLLLQRVYRASVGDARLEPLHRRVVVEGAILENLVNEGLLLLRGLLLEEGAVLDCLGDVVVGMNPGPVEDVREGAAAVTDVLKQRLDVLTTAPELAEVGPGAAGLNRQIAVEPIHGVGAQSTTPSHRLERRQL